MTARSMVLLSAPRRLQAPLLDCGSDHTGVASRSSAAARAASSPRPRGVMMLVAQRCRPSFFAAPRCCGRVAAARHRVEATRCARKAGRTTTAARASYYNLPKWRQAGGALLVNTPGKAASFPWLRREPHAVLFWSCRGTRTLRSPAEGARQVASLAWSLVGPCAVLRHRYR